MPATQVVHDEAPAKVSVSVTLPAAQETHALLKEYFPAGQTQADPVDTDEPLGHEAAQVLLPANE